MAVYLGKDGYKYPTVSFSFTPWHVTVAFNNAGASVPSRSDMKKAVRFLAEDIRDLAKTEGFKIKINRKNESLGVIDLDCDDAFISKVCALPRVARVDREVTRVDKYRRLRW